MSRAVSGRRSAIRNATSDSWRISFSVSCDIAPSLPLEATRAYAFTGRAGSGRDARAVEMLVRRAVLALRQRRPLARLPLARRRVAARRAVLERPRLDL